MSKSSDNEKKVSYHTLRVELDQLLAQLEDESLDIEEAIKKYQRAKTIVDELEAYISDLEDSFSETKQSDDASQ